jgi:hypothetical protein
LTLPRLNALNRYWKLHPPVHLLVAQYLDYKAPASAAPERQDEAMAELMASMPIQADAPKLDTSAWDSFLKERDHG